MAVFDTLLPAKFENVVFPVERVEIRGGLRDHVHEYPHSPGGAPEKLGRKLYEIHMTANFQANFRDYPNLWPDGLKNLRRVFEAEETNILVVPTVGNILAYCTNWSQTMDSKIRSGEKAEFTFREDDSGQFLAASLAVPNSTSSLAAKGERFSTEADKLVPKPSLFDDITDSVNSVLAIKDQAGAFSTLLQAKVQGLVSLCQQAEGLAALNDPLNFTLLDSLKDVWSTAVQLSQDLLSKNVSLQTYVTPRNMSVSDVAKAIYGDAKRGVDILQLNPIEDAFAIPAGTSLKYYPS